MVSWTHLHGVESRIPASLRYNFRRILGSSSILHWIYSTLRFRKCAESTAMVPGLQLRHSILFHTLPGICLHCCRVDIFVRRALVMLCEQLIRWSDAGLYIHEEEIDVLYQVKNRIPLLQALMLHVDSVGSIQTDSDTFIDAPVLSTLDLWTRAPLTFPWASLTSLSFDVAVDDFRTRFHVLSETVNLKELSIRGRYSSEITGYGEQIMLSRLPRLSVCSTAALTCLKTPALVRLSIGAGATEPFSTIVGSFLHRSCCNLQQLEIEGSSVSNFMELVEYTSNLRHLHITLLVGIFAISQNLTANDSRTTPLRHLRSLRLDNPIYSDELDLQLCVLVKSRYMRVESEGEMFVERLRTLIILQQDRQDYWTFGTKLEKVCEECGVRFRYFGFREDVPDIWW